MIRMIACMKLFIACGLAQASPWIVETKLDSMTDKLQKSATARNVAGFALSFYRRDAGEVWALFALPDGNFEVLGSQLPMYRIDALPPVDIESSKRVDKLIGRRSFSAEPKWVNFSVWHGQGEPLTGTLRNFMDGSRVVFRYYLLGGGYKETSFDLQGAKAAIAEAVGVQVEADPVAAKLENERKAAFAAASAKCDAEYPLSAAMASKNRDCRLAAIQEMRSK